MTVTPTTTTLVVAEQDEALHFYTMKSNFEKKADGPWGDGLRWISVAPASNPKISRGGFKPLDATCTETHSSSSNPWRKQNPETEEQ